ncbi:MAG: ADP-forming succinate--CoA ligase subunit beta [Nitrospirae bacterium]|nr:MAG: ADP-forming succinate--CoA ligase subunit beta [Nitrospirota bacterium]
MNIHEYQAKELFRAYGVPVPEGRAAATVDEAVGYAEAQDWDVYVVKAQIHAGGRGKAGGVKITRDKHEVRALAESIYGKTLVTHQTGPQGKLVQRLLIEKGSNIERELYLSMIVDRAAGMPVIIASTEGGMEIEKVAAEQPEKIVTVHVDPVIGLQGFHCRRIAFALGLTGDLMKQCGRMLAALYRLFHEKDCSQIEINPLVVTAEGELVALDAKVNFEDNALFRHKDILELRDLSEEEELEIRASEWDLNYIKLDGNIGCMVNGAGLAMATMDIIALAGAMPANFLDVGGTATAERVAEAFKIILADPGVKGIFVNIFGGIVRCDRIAQGIIDAAKMVDLKVPLVVRLQGTNAEQARAMLAESGLPLETAEDLWEGAQKIAAAVK